MKKFIILLFLILSIPFILTGCYDSKSIENYYYAVALGIDSSDKANIKLSIQVATSDSSDSGSSSQSSQSKIYSVDCDSLDVGISILNNYLSKEINLSHCSAIIFSEKIAKDGVGKFINTLANNPQIRPTANILICNKDSTDILENISDSGESFSSRYYEFVINSVDYTGYAPNSEFGRFFYNINNNLEPATANYILVKDKNIQSLGTAIFNSDKFIGTLSPLQSLAHLIVTGRLQESTISIPDPFDESSKLEILLQKNKSPSTDITLLNGTPYIKTKAHLTGKIVSAPHYYNYNSRENLDVIKNELNNYIKDLIDDYYYIIIKKYNADVANLCDKISSQYLTKEEFDKINWNKIYKDSFYTVEVDSIISTSLFTGE